MPTKQQSMKNGKMLHRHTREDTIDNKTIYSILVTIVRACVRVCVFWSLVESPGTEKGILEIHSHDNSSGELTLEYSHFKPSMLCLTSTKSRFNKKSNKFISSQKVIFRTGLFAMHLSIKWAKWTSWRVVSRDRSVEFKWFKLVISIYLPSRILNGNLIIL